MVEKMAIDKDYIVLNLLLEWTVKSEKHEISNKWYVAEAINNHHSKRNIADELEIVEYTGTTHG